MISESWLTDVIGLQERTQGLVKRLSDLAPLAQRNVVEQLLRGAPPDAPTLGALGAASAEAEDVLVAASALGISVPEGEGITHLLSVLHEAIERESWNAIRSEYRPVAERMLCVAHKSGQVPPFLQGLHSRAQQCVDALSSPSPPDSTTRQEWGAKVQPFRDLWLLLDDPESLSDLQAEELLGRLEQDFGRSLVSAVMLRRLSVQKTIASCVEEPSDLALVESKPLMVARPAAEAPVPAASLDAAAPAFPSAAQLESADKACGTASPPSVEHPETAEPAIVTPPELELGHAETEVGAPLDLPPAEMAQTKEAAIAAPPQVESRPAEAESCAPPTPPCAEQPAKKKGAVSAPPEVESPPPDSETGAMLEALPAQISGVKQSKPVLNAERCEGLRDLIWRMVAANRVGLSYQLARCAESLAPTGLLPPSALLAAAALGPRLRSSSGEVVEQLRNCVESLQHWLLDWQDQETDEHVLAARLLLFGLSLRPTLLAPGAGVLPLIQAVSALDSLSPALGEIRRGVAEFASLNLELSPTVLKGVCDHAIWQQQLDALRSEARSWLDSNRQANIIYAPTTDVWHCWLERSRSLGRVLEIVIGQQVARAEEVRQAAHHWLNRKNVERELARTDEEIRKVGARRRPIEARARTAICSRVQEFVRLAQRWLDLLNAEPRPLDDYRQEQADRCRNVVQRFLTAALTDAGSLANAGGTSIALSGAVRFVRTALEDIGHLFDASREETPHVFPVRVLLGEELLMLPAFPLDENWRPSSPAGEEMLRQLEDLSEREYDPETAFANQSTAKNHRATLWVIEALEVRPECVKVVERMKADRDQALVHCRQALARKLNDTRQSVEQAVCYDLITAEERERFLGAVEEGRIVLDEVSDFAAEDRRLEEIDRLIQEKQQQRVREVERKLKETETTISPDLQQDLDIVRQTLARGDFLSADEYIGLLRTGQPLSRVAAPPRSVVNEFFPAFVQRFNAFMEGDGRNRHEPRDVVDRIREAGLRGRDRNIGPIDMRGVPGPQATEAAEMLTAWLRLKNRSADAGKDLVPILTAFGLRDVRVELSTSLAAPHWSALCQCTPLGDPTVCIIPRFGSQARGRYRILGLFDRPDEEAIVNLVREVGGAEPILVLYFGRMTEQRRRDLAELCWQRRRSFLVIDETVVFFLCSERFSRLPVLFQAVLPFTVVEPYTTTASLVPVEMFFGREQERRAVLDPYGTNLVYGGRQLGKSALLRDVERREHNPAQGRIVRWIDLKNRGIGIDRPAEDLWSVLGQELHEEDVLPRLATTHQTVVERIKDWLKAVETRRILLLLDEADAFLEADSRAVSEQTRHSFPHGLVP